MGLRINTNVEAVNAHRNLQLSALVMSKSMEKLSSGLRINRASDDAAGLAISEKLRGQVKGLNQAIRNAQDGISLIQTAEGALNETHSILQRMRELAVQAANDTLTTSDRNAIAAELNQLTAEITRISDTTEFNTMKLLDGTFTNKLLQIGANGNQTLSVSVSGADATDLGVNALNVSSAAQASAAIGSIDTGLGMVSSIRASLGAVQNRLEHTIANLGVASENLLASESRIRDVDMAQEMMNFTKVQILQQAGTAMLAQANTSPQTVLQLLR
jgi:flagellin